VCDLAHGMQGPCIRKIDLQQ